MTEQTTLPSNRRFPRRSTTQRTGEVHVESPLVRRSTSYCWCCCAKDLVKAVKGNAIVPSFVLGVLTGAVRRLRRRGDDPGRHRQQLQIPA